MISRRRVGTVVLVSCLAVAAASGPLAGQLLSPGPLSNAHASLEGIRNCTKCHELGQPGASQPRCLGCHQPLGEALREGRGYHARVEGDCASCHAEHFGRDFQLVRFDSLSFDHAVTGYVLEGRHDGVACAGCHQEGLVRSPSVLEFRRVNPGTGRSFLGLSEECASCHDPDDPHGSQFAGRSCGSCHDPGGWAQAERFDHQQARYPLTGRHRDVPCSSCHVAGSGPGSAVGYRSLVFDSCASCHQDPHDALMVGPCERCHETTGWEKVDEVRLEGRFDHAKTGFVLTGRHASLSCTSCHDQGAADELPGIRLQFLPQAAERPFPRPSSQTCQSCHLDFHEGLFQSSPGEGDCEACHGEGAWVPSLYDVARHDSETAFPLEDAHEAAPCEGCHRDGDVLVLQPRSQGCAACHAAEDPHGPDPEDHACEGCHVAASFEQVSFDHSGTGFALEGAHVALTCDGCHLGSPDSLRFEPISTECQTCHASDDPHGQQFEGRSCDGCHLVSSFKIESFDHTKTRFPLEGAHETVPCAACHLDEVDVGGALRARYVPTSTRCRDCHGGAG